MGRVLLGAALACLGASALAAQSAVEITRSVYVEKRDERAGRTIEPAVALRRGDKVVLVVEWRASDSPRGFTVSSAVPRDLAFQRSGDAAQVSIDGGRNWGSLESLRAGDRRASPEDVTHLRWRVPADRVADGRGTLTYSAIVR